MSKINVGVVLLDGSIMSAFPPSSSGKSHCWSKGLMLKTEAAHEERLKAQTKL
jgi:hypothetical protein